MTTYSNCIYRTAEPPNRRTAGVSPSTKDTTPAEAGAQLGDGGNDGLRVITTAFPIGRRPPPGW